MKSMVGESSLSRNNTYSEYTILVRIIHRYIDGIFFTSNEPLDRINQMLDEASNLHPNIKLVRHIGTSVSFLDLQKDLPSNCVGAT
jgi:hypothetical protein